MEANTLITDLKSISGCYISDKAEIGDGIDCPTEVQHKNVFPTKSLAEAALALAQLLQLRDFYNNGWVPNWMDGIYKYCLFVYEDEIHVHASERHFYIMHFKTQKLRNAFFKEPKIKRLLEIAKPLL